MSWVRISSPAPNFPKHIKVLQRKLDAYFLCDFLLVPQPVPLLSHDSRYWYHFMHGCIDLVVYRKRHMQVCINNRFTGTILCVSAIAGTILCAIASLPIWLTNIPPYHFTRQSSGYGSIHWRVTPTDPVARQFHASYSKTIRKITVFVVHSKCWRAICRKPSTPYIM